MLSRKILANYDTADFRDCVNQGYTFTLYADGHITAQYHSQWSGARTGQRWITDAGYVDPSTIDVNEPDQDAMSHLVDRTVDVDPRFDADYRQTRAGFYVR